MVQSCVTRLDSVEASRFDLSSGTLSHLQRELESFLGKSNVITDPLQCFDRSNTDWAPAKHDQKPAIVVTPRCTEDVSKTLSACCRSRVPVTSCSGRTSLTGSLISTRGGVCVDFGSMKSVLTIHKDDLDAIVQPGVGWRELHDQLSPMGLFFPPDPGPKACIGGMISTSCAGTNAYRYGTMKEWVIALTVVLADGTIVQTKRRPRKASIGYDLTHLMIGAEGTLGLVTEAVIRLAPLPVNQNVAVAIFPSPKEAMKAGLALIASGITYDALELLDGNSMKVVNLAQLSDRHWLEKPTIFLKVSGPSTSVKDALEATQDLVTAHQGIAFETTEDKDKQKIYWDARKFAGRALYETRQDSEAFYLCSDSTVPISRVSDLMEEAYQMSDAIDVPSAFIVHLGDGNVHCQVLASPSKLEVAKEMISKLELRAADMEGTISGEHGIGISRRDELIYDIGPNAVDMMRTIKLALDPHRILNPDKILRLDP